MLMDAEVDALPVAQQASALMKRADQLRAEGQRETAYGCVVRSLDLYRSLGDAGNTVRCLISLSYYAGWVNFGDGLDIYDRRSRLAEEALPLARTLGNDALLAHALCSFDPDEAQLQESVTLARKSGDLSVLALALQKWGGFVARSGAEEEGQTLLEEALAVAREAKDTLQIATTLLLLGMRRQGPHRLACLQEAAALYRECHDTDTRILLLMRLANMEEGQDLGQRQAWIEEALALCRDRPVGPNAKLNVCACLTILARLLRQGGDDAYAAACEQEAEAYGPLPDVHRPSPARLAAMNAAYATRDHQTIIAASRQFLMP